MLFFFGLVWWMLSACLFVLLPFIFCTFLFCVWGLVFLSSAWDFATSGTGFEDLIKLKENPILFTESFVECLRNHDFEKIYLKKKKKRVKNKHTLLWVIIHKNPQKLSYRKGFLSFNSKKEKFHI